MISLFTYLKPYRLLIMGVFLLTFLQALSQLYLPNIMSGIVDTGIAKGDTGYILRQGGVMLLVAIAGGLCIVGASFLAARTGAGFGRDVRARLFARVESFSLQEFDLFGTASLITRTTNDVTQVQQVTVMIMRLLLMAPLMAVGGIIMAVQKDTRLSLLIVVVVPVLSVLITLIASRAIPLFKSIQVKVDNLNRVLRERLTGIRVIRAFDRTDHERRRFNEANTDLTQTSVKAFRIVAVAMPTMIAMMNLTTVAIVWFGGIRIDAGAMQVGDLMAFIQYVMHIMFALILVTMMFVMIPRASASAARINGVLKESPKISDPERPVRGGGKKGYLEFRNVTFSYPGAEAPAVRDVSFDACPGEVTAIIGGTGSGKSTLINLLPRFYDVQQGAILVDGVDVRELSQEDLRSRIGYVPQQAVLFTGSVAENIRYGKHDASLAEIRHAAETAQANGFIATMEEKYDSILAQAGANVSGGQKQRLSIARALVRKPEIYIFDDTFSALDFKTDALLREALRKETAGSTVLIVAQRAATVLDAEKIIVLEEGSITGIGTHTELMKGCEVYREIVRSQLSSKELT